MSWTRRTFLGTTAVSAAFGAIGSVTGSAAASPARGLRRATFAPLTGRTLVATSKGQRTRVRLAAVRDVPGARRGSDASFILELAASRPLADGLYALSHHRTGSHRVFLSGVGPADQRRYAVVVNRAVPKDA